MIGQAMGGEANHYPKRRFSGNIGFNQLFVAEKNVLCVM
jgi:hypothetical protein